jgi:hypothetical protein
LQKHLGVKESDPEAVAIFQRCMGTAEREFLPSCALASAAGPQKSKTGS